MIVGGIPVCDICKIHKIELARSPSGQWRKHRLGLPLEITIHACNVDHAMTVDDTQLVMEMPLNNSGMKPS